MNVPMIFRFAVHVAVAIVVFSVNLIASDDRKSELEFFESKIRPVLVRECYSCHSEPAAKEGKLRGQLKLDSREATLAGGESGPVIVVGKPDESLLISALRHESLEMPPKGKLSEAIIADFVKWIELGAIDPRETDEPTPANQTPSKSIDIDAGRSFWSFLPLQKSDVPKPTERLEWVHNDIDRFILAKMERVVDNTSPADSAQGSLYPNGIADARTLIRRAWMDLLGLPPDPDSMDHWRRELTRQGPSGKPEFQMDVWQQLLEHLLEQSAFGEKQARHWMDIARFAESHGYEQDYDRPNAYHYRDFLIRAFNEDLPFDQFLRWQIAGDLIAPDQPLAWMATGFLGAGAFPTQLTEAEFESARYDELDDMVATTGVAFMGISLGCARCHDHKFDPIPTADYYRFAANFTKVIRSEKQFDLHPEENSRRRTAHAEKLKSAEIALAKYRSEQQVAEFGKWVHRLASKEAAQSRWQLFSGELRSTASTSFQRLEDGSFLATGQPPAKDEFVFTAELTKTTLGAIRVEALTHATLPNRGPGRAPNGNFALGDFTVTVLGKDGERSTIRLAKAVATHQQNESSLSVQASVDSDPVSGWAVDGQIGRDQAAVFSLAEPIVLNESATIEIRLLFNHPNPQHAMGRIRLSVALETLPPEIGGTGPTLEIVDAVKRMDQAVRETDVTMQALAISRPEDWKIAFPYFQSIDPQDRELSNQLEQLKSDGSIEKLTTVMVASEGLPHLKHHADDRGFPHFYPVTYQLRRGDVHQKVKPAEPGFLQVLDRNYEVGSGVDAVADGTLSPLGSPSRAALAYWMTDTKRGPAALVARVIVNRLWQQHFGKGLVTTPNDFGLSGDRPTHPELLDYLANQLIEHRWHLKPIHQMIMSSAAYMQSSQVPANDARFRLDIDNQFYWRRVPRRLEAEAIRDSLLAVSGLLDRTLYGPGTLDVSMNRRSVYFFIKRSQLIPMMMLFDWPEHLVSIGQRPQTTIAPQALAFLNSPQGRGYASALADRVASQKADADRTKAIAQAYRLALSRNPTETETNLANEFLDRQTKARQSMGPIASQESFVDFCQALLGTNEFIYID